MKDLRLKIKDLRSIFLILLLTSYFLLLAPVLAQAPQNANVSVTVAPVASDFQFDYESTDGLTNVPQGTVLEYQITYGAQSSAGLGTTTILEADYSDDLAPGGSHVLDYVTGSATTAYGGVSAVVDLTNRKITWTIPNLPQGTTDQIVGFQLRTNSNYTGAIPVDFDTTAGMSNQYVTMPDETITQTYTFDPSLVPTPTPTPTSSPTATPGLSPSGIPTTAVTRAPTPAPVFSNLPRITGVDFINITSNSATISVATSIPTRNTVFYGTSPTSLSQKAESQNYSVVSSISLNNLTPDTTYYFRIESIDTNGNKVNSEIFTFRTAKESATPFKITDGAVTIDSMGQRVYSKIISPESSPGFVLLTEDTDFTLSYTPQSSTDYKSFDVVIKDKNGLVGIIGNLSNKQALLYIAQLRIGDQGRYEIFLKATDPNGNVTEQKIADLKVVPFLRVLEQESSEPVGDARVLLYKLVGSKYQRITDIKNPQFTDKDGKINLILTPGKYKAEASAFLYDPKTVEFTIGNKDGEEFPTIYLARNPFNITALIGNLINYFDDSFDKLMDMTRSLSSSSRAFRIVATGITAAFSLLSLLLFTLKTHMDFKKLPVFFFFGLHMVLKKHKENFVFGTVVDKNKASITRARIELLDKATGQLITHTTSNKFGRFHFHKIDPSRDVKLRVGKEGYIEEEVGIGDDNDLRLVLKSEGARPVRVPGIRIIEHVGGSLFETALILSIVLELFFLSNFGLLRTLPFFTLSLFNILLWSFYLNDRR